jgi:pyruvate dehydrogenase E1 component beta subunit
VPSELYSTPIGKAALRRRASRERGSTVTLVGISYMAHEAVEAAALLSEQGVDAEVVDLRSLKPWDSECVLDSVRKSGRAVVCDSGWRTAGAAAEIAATISADAFHDLEAPVERVTLPDVPAPVASTEESAYYPGSSDIVEAALRTLSGQRIRHAISLQGAAA